MTLGQIAMYEVFKEAAVSKLNMPDVTPTHLFCSAMAGVCGAAFTMPFDVMKTRMMNATVRSENKKGKKQKKKLCCKRLQKTLVFVKWDGQIWPLLVKKCPK